MHASNKKLYRPEAVKYATENFYGTILLTKPISFMLLTAFFTSLIIIVILFFIFTSYTRKTHTSGVLLPEQGLIRILPIKLGTVTKVYIKEGQQVNADDPLFIISNEVISSSKGNTELIIGQQLLSQRDSLLVEQESLLLQLNKKQLTLKQKLIDLQEEEKRYNQQINAQKRRTELAKDIVKRFHELLQKNYIASIEYQEQQAIYLEQETRLAEYKRELTAVIREKNLTYAELDETHLLHQRELALNQRNVHNIEKELAEHEARREIIIKAPQAGIISNITVEIGQHIEQSQLLATLSPNNSLLEANLFVTSESIGFIQPNMQVFLRYPAYPYQKFGQFQGKVKEITHNAIRPEELGLLGINSRSTNENELLYRVRIQLNNQSVKTYGEEKKLKTGMLVEASILLEKRKIYEWILEPLYSISGKI